MVVIVVIVKRPPLPLKRHRPQEGQARFLLFEYVNAPVLPIGEYCLKLHIVACCMELVFCCLQLSF